MDLSMKPERKLEVLSTWINKVIDNYPVKYVSFDAWLLRKYPSEFEGTPEYARKISTHCFYCSRKFTDNVKKTIDHWIPKSANIKTPNRYVICCQQCNVAKSNARPETIIHKCNKAIFSGKAAYGHQGKKLELFQSRISSVYNDSLFGVERRLYFKSDKRQR